MAKLSVFNFITLNGYYKGPGEDISWHKNDDPEKNEYAAKGAESDSILLFGRKTYELMVQYWPTPQAFEQAREVAEGMNNSQKIVFSKTLKKADWKNTRIIRDDMAAEVKKLKKTSDSDLTILGSGSIVTQLTEEGLIDQYHFMVDPVVLGEGTPVFEGIAEKVDLKLINSKTFKSGVVVLTYEPVRKEGKTSNRLAHQHELTM